MTCGRACACRALTAVIRLRGIVDELPAETVAADDLADELAALAASVDAAQRHAQPIRDAGAQRHQACPDDQRRRSKLRLELDVIHDVDPDELLAVLAERCRATLAADDVDVDAIAEGWEEATP